MKKLLFALLIITTALSCGKDDPCENITCVNGFCANGDCNCDEGWTGSDCSQKKTPDYILIKSIKVTKFPATEDDGGGWDVFDGPDLTVSILYNGSSIADATVFYEDATQGGNYSFDFTDARVNNPTGRYVIALYDYDDFDPNDYMAGIEFTPFSASSPTFEEVLNLDFAGSPVAFQLTVEYVFN